jgi:hypothetical protein
LLTQKRGKSGPEANQNKFKTTAKQQQNKRKTTERIGKTSSKQQQNNGEGGTGNFTSQVTGAPV